MPRAKKKVEPEEGEGGEEALEEPVAPQFDELDEAEAFEEVDLTTLSGVGPTIAKRLTEAGFTTLESIALTSPAELSAAAGIPMSTASKIIASARKILKVDVMTAFDYYQKRKSVQRITTGTKALDDLLGGGVETQAITEIYGPYGSGKCVAGDTLVPFINEGNVHFERISDAYEFYMQRFGETRVDEGFAVPLSGVKVLALNEDGSTRAVEASYLYRERVRTILEVKTRKGRILRLTPKHRLLSMRKTDNRLGWCPAGQLSPGDLIAAPKVLRFPAGGDSPLTREDAYFLGLFVAEGTPNPLSLSTTDEEIKDWVVRYIAERHGYLPRVRVDTRSGRKVYTILLRAPSRKFLGRLAKCKAGEKFIPESVFSAPPEVAMEFLRGYVKGDGYLGKAVELTTKSRLLAHQLTYLMKSFGFDVSVRCKNVEGKTYYKLYVVGSGKGSFLKMMGREGGSSVSPYGYPEPIVVALREFYKRAWGGEKGAAGKSVGKRSTSRGYPYRILIGDARGKSVSDETLLKIRSLFLEMRDSLLGAKDLAGRLERLSVKELRKLVRSVPFPILETFEKAGVPVTRARNYLYRGIPESLPELGEVKARILTEIDRRLSVLEEAVRFIDEVRRYEWDVIVSSEEVPFDDYVYDFVVPDGHTFIGGGMPTLLHNTQLCHQLAVTVQLPIERGGLGRRCLYIDTEGTFRPERIVQIAERFELDPETTLKNILVARAFTADHQMVVTEKAEPYLKKYDIGLIIVDSLISHFRGEFVGRENLAARQQKLNKYLHKLLRYALGYNLAVLVTNQVIAQPDAFFGDPNRPAGGHVLGHGVTARLYIKRAKGNRRLVKLVKSPYLPEDSVEVAITGGGVEDV